MRQTSVHEGHQAQRSPWREGLGTIVRTGGGGNVVCVLLFFSIFSRLLTPSPAETPKIALRGS